jgi:hypothetical protein
VWASPLLMVGWFTVAIGNAVTVVSGLLFGLLAIVGSGWDDFMNGTSRRRLSIIRSSELWWKGCALSPNRCGAADWSSLVRAEVDEYVRLLGTGTPCFRRKHT